MARTAGKSKSFTTIARVSPSEQIREQITIAVDGERVTGKVGEELDLSRIPAEAIDSSKVASPL